MATYLSTGGQTFHITADQSDEHIVGEWDNAMTAAASRPVEVVFGPGTFNLSSVTASGDVATNDGVFHCPESAAFDVAVRGMGQGVTTLLVNTEFAQPGAVFTYFHDDTSGAGAPSFSLRDITVDVNEPTLTHPVGFVAAIRAAARDGRCRLERVTAKNVLGNAFLLQGATTASTVVNPLFEAEVIDCRIEGLSEQAAHIDRGGIFFMDAPRLFVDGLFVDGAANNASLGQANGPNVITLENNSGTTGLPLNVLVRNLHVESLLAGSDANFGRVLKYHGLHDALEDDMVIFSKGTVKGDATQSTNPKAFVFDHAAVGDGGLTILEGFQVLDWPGWCVHIDNVVQKGLIVRNNRLTGASVGIAIDTAAGSEGNLIYGNDVRDAGLATAAIFRNSTIGCHIFGNPGEAPYTLTGDSTDRALDAGTPTAADNANVLATLIRDLGLAD